jgi:acetyl esterase
MRCNRVSGLPCFFCKCGKSNPSNSKENKLPTVSFTLPGEELMKLAEKYRYKKTPQADLCLNLLHPEEKAKGAIPTIVYFCGGGWVDGNVAPQIPNAAWFRDQGIIGITADCRVKNRHGTSPLECIAHSKSTFRYIRAHAKEFSINPDKIIVAGGSVGG